MGSSLVNTTIRPSNVTPASLPGGARRARRRAGYGAGVVVILCMALVVAPVRAANTEPTLALMRASAARSTSGPITVTLEGSFSLADTVQLQLPLQVRVTQGSLAALCGVTGGASVSLGGGPPRDAPPPCVIGISDRTLTLVLPSEFGPGAATAQLLLMYENKPIASNQLSFTL